MEGMIHQGSRARAVGGGVLAGIIAGAALAIYLVVMNSANGGDIWQPLKGAGLPVLGERAAAPGFDANAVAIGVGIHMAISIFWGVLFSILFWGASKIGTLTLGAAWGVVIWLVMYYLVLPLAGLAHIARSTPVDQALLEHVIFGVVLALVFLPYQRRLRAIEPTLADQLGPGPSR